EILRPDGESYRDIRPLVRVNVSVVAGQGERQESGSKGYGGREGYARFIETKAWRDAADGALREALVNLESVPAPAGEMDVVLGAGWPGVMLHEAVGHGSRQGYAHVAMPRMTNTYMLAGERDPAEIIASVKNGIYAVNFGGGQVDITSGKYVFQCTEAYKIEDGKVAAPVKGAMLIGNGPTDLHRISMIGNDLELDGGIGTCGKNGQGVPVGVGQPTLRMERLTVGGTG